MKEGYAPAAESGDADGLSRLGECMLCGIGGETDVDAGLDLLEETSAAVTSRPP
ncbi:MAG: hypothetical protein MJZ38_06345 [archaeon]|nr:hypothetical protein [archaeon]